MEIQVADALLGSLIDGRYRVRGRVARGGMATVYTATDERLERTVALKIIHPAQAAEPHFVERFIEEAKTIARLTHPNVVAVYDQGTYNGLPYLVMEYVRGRTLREIVTARRRLTPVEALSILEQVLAGLAAAHRAGLVHRDVKPENVLVAEAPSGGTTNLVDSVAKVADFGLARAVQASSEEPVGGQLLATVAYVAPELVAEGRSDARSDVYSAGVVLFETITGRVPYDAGQPAEVAWQHVDRDLPPPSRYINGLPAAVDDLVRRATRRDPDARPADAGALLAEVQLVREEVTTSAVRPRPTSTGEAPAADATVVMSAVPPASRSATVERPAWARLPSPKVRPEPGRGDPARTRLMSGLATGGAPGGGRGPSPRGPVRHGPVGRGAAVARAGLATGRNRALVIGAAVLVLLLAAGGWWLGVGRYMPAPTLVSLAQADAVARAQAQGLTVTFAEPRYNEQVAADLVLSQRPGPGERIVKGGTVTLILSLGPERYPVPDIVGVEYDVAVRQLEGLRLVPQRAEDRYSDNVPEGRVLAVEPAVNEQVGPGTTVTVTVSKGKSPTTVPLLIGMQVQQAQATLAQLGLVASIVPTDSTRPANEVVGQDPASDSGVEPGATVTLEVSKGPPTVPVPDVMGRPCEEARQLLEQAGFKVKVEIGERGAVLFQNPSAGTGLPKESEVTIVCAP
jgi:serine/threonine-protein kinase